MFGTMKYKFLIPTAICTLHFILSMAIVYLNPRFDLISFFAFFAVSIILWVVLILWQDNIKRHVESQIHLFISSLQNEEPGKLQNRSEDDGLSMLDDEIRKIVGEKRSVAAAATAGRNDLMHYTEDLAHQIKTPLTGMLAMVDLIAEDPEGREDYSNLLRRGIHRLEHLTDIMLKLAAIESQVTVMKREKVNSDYFLDALMEDLSAIFSNKRWNCTQKGDNIVLYCDSKWTYEALLNLAKNAIEASPRGEIVVETKESNLYYSLSVIDFGEGMTHHELSRALLRFYKKDPDGEGYGIGLPMADAIMKRQEGDLLYMHYDDYNIFEMRFYKEN